MENSDSTSVSDVERIKWFVSRIDLYHRINIESVENSKRIFDNAGEKTLTKIKSWKKGVFSVLGIILTVILGINSVYSIPEWIFYSLLAVLSGVGFVNFLIFNWLEGLVDMAFTFISNVSSNARNIIAESQAFVASQFADLEHIKLKSVQNYGVFSILLGVAVIVNMKNLIKEFGKNKQSWFVNLFKEEFKEIEKITEKVPELYGRFEKSENYPKTGYELIEKTLEKYVKNKQ